MALYCLAVFLLHAVVTTAAPSVTRRATQATCKVIPGDAGWPNARLWAQLNQTVNGKLHETVLLAQVCHGAARNDAQCNQLRSDWGLASLVYVVTLQFFFERLLNYSSVPSPTEFLSSWFQNNTCTPFSPSCEPGNHASYFIDVRSVGDVQAGLAFARQHNVRLVVKNSGHDFYSKSTGKGALSLWMHNLNSATFLPQYNASYYTGPAVHIEAGVSGRDAAALASVHGHRVVVGSCPTVKAAGGFTQGGGHSYLTGFHGFGADNVLEWEAVTAAGEHVVATPTNEHAGLYWALSGGSPGTFAVVLSMKVRAFPDGDIALAAMTMGVQTAGSVDAYWNAVSTFHSEMRPLVDQGFVAEYAVTNDTLQLFGMVAPGQTAESLRAALAPLLAALQSRASATLTADAMGLNISHSTSYHDLYAATVEPLMAANSLPPAVAGRLVPRAVLEAENGTWHAALRRAVSMANGRYFASITTFNARRAGRTRPVAPNAVQPNLQTAFSTVIITPHWANTEPWSDAADLERELEGEVMPVLEAATPGAGAYKNEASWAQKDFQNAFYAGTYARLSALKAKYDSGGIFYGRTAVGSEAWALDGDGRLCKASLAQ